jgi:digeranylgeranylglycerophospholipid reductase
MPKRYDAVVIGAGPAGLMAAKTLAENGFAIALLERKQSIARIRRADGGAIGINEYLYDRLVLFNAHHKKFCFPVDGFSVPYDGPYANIYGFQMYSPGKKRILFGDWEEAKRRGDEVRVGISISKEALLSGLLEDCRCGGVEVFPGINLTDIRKTRDSVLVNGDGQLFEGSFVIAADGVNSRTVRLLGLNTGRKFKGTYRYLTWMLKGAVPVDPGSFNFMVTEKGTYALYDTYEQGVYHVSAFNSDPAADLNESLHDLVYRDKTYAPWFAGCARTEIINCVSNILSPIEVPFKDNVLIIGDAAWIMEFSNMAALCNGWKAGNAVTLALMDRKYNKEGVKSYLEWWKKNFYIPYGRFEFGPMGGGGTILQSYLSSEELDYLASLIDKPLPATMNFFTLFNTLGSAYAELFPRIYDERPEVMDKLFALRNRFDEIGESIRRAGFPNL